MLTHTRPLRFLIGLVALGLSASLVLAYFVLDAWATEDPTVSRFRLLLTVAVAAGTVPWFLAVKPFGDLLALVDSGEAFSPDTLLLLRRIRRLFAFSGVYLVVGFLATAGILQAAPVFLVFVAGEIAIWFVVALVRLLELLFGQASELRIDSELTI